MQSAKCPVDLAQGLKSGGGTSDSAEVLDTCLERTAANEMNRRRSGQEQSCTTTIRNMQRGDITHPRQSE